ncbi:hypothetical protein D3C75_424480 [compost metagenome]
MAFFVAKPIDFPWVLTIRFRRDGVGCLLSCNPIPNPFGAISFVAKNMTSCNIKLLK